MTIIEEISQAIQNGKMKIIKELVPQAIEQGHTAQEILNDGLLHGMGIVGDRFTRNEAFVPEVLVAARAMNKGTELIKPLLAAEGSKPIGKACIGTVQGDLHDIGKNIEVIDLGVDVSPEKFAETAKNEGCNLVCCSALLTTTMPVMEKVVVALKEAGVRDQVTVLVGGAPVTQEFCDQIGADIYTADGASAANKAAAILTA